MYLLKTNELARDFEVAGGFNIFSKLLFNDAKSEVECTRDHQIAYNVVAASLINS